MKHSEKLLDTRSGRHERLKLRLKFQQRAMNPLIKDRELAHRYLRGELDNELYKESAATVIAPKGSVHKLENCAKKHSVLKLHGQRGLSSEGGMRLLEMVGDDMKTFPSFEEIMS